MEMMEDGCRRAGSACGHARHAAPDLSEEALGQAAGDSLTLSSALMLAACGVLGLVAAYNVGVAVIDGFEFLMKCITVLGANPFGWTL